MEKESKNKITFFYKFGDRLSIVNIDTDMVISRVCTFDKRKFQKNKKFSKDYLEKRREFRKI